MRLALPDTALPVDEIVVATFDLTDVAVDGGHPTVEEIVDLALDPYQEVDIPDGSVLAESVEQDEVVRFVRDAHALGARGVHHLLARIESYAPPPLPLESVEPALPVALASPQPPRPPVPDAELDDRLAAWRRALQGGDTVGALRAWRALRAGATDPPWEYLGPTPGYRAWADAAARVSQPHYGGTTRVDEDGYEEHTTGWCEGGTNPIPSDWVVDGYEHNYRWYGGSSSGERRRSLEAVARAARWRAALPTAIAEPGAEAFFATLPMDELGGPPYTDAIGVMEGRALQGRGRRWKPPPNVVGAIAILRGERGGV